MTHEQVEKEIEKLAQQAKLLGDLYEVGLTKYVEFISSDIIFLRADVPFMEARRGFRAFFHEMEKMKCYYMSQGRLAVKFLYGPHEVVFYFSNADVMLHKVSRGRCHIQEKEVVQINQAIACEV